MGEVFTKVATINGHATQDFNLLPALLVGTIAAHGVTVLLLRRSILTEKVARRGFHVMREYSVDPLTMVRVGEVMDKNIAAIPANMPLIELSDRIARHDPSAGSPSFLAPIRGGSLAI